MCVKRVCNTKTPPTVRLSGASGSELTSRYILSSGAHEVLVRVLPASGFVMDRQKVVIISRGDRIPARMDEIRFL